MNIVLLCGFLPDNRVEKRIRLLKDLGNLHVICWDRVQNMVRTYEEGCQMHVIRIPAKNNPLKRMIPFMKFEKEAKNLLKELQPDIIWSLGLDMLKIAVNFDCRQVYEVADLHRLIVDKSINPIKIIAKIYLKHLEKKCSEKVDLLVVTSEKFFDVYLHNYYTSMMLLPNIPDLSAFDGYTKTKHPFTIGYIGGVRYKKQMENLIEAAKKTNTRLFIAGNETGKQKIRKQCMEFPNGEWYGPFNFQKEACQLYERCDVMYSVYNADMGNVRVALPNKLYESIYCQIPIIVAKNTYLAEVVKNLGVGIAVDHNDPVELSVELTRLQTDPEYYQSFVDHCKNITLDPEKYEKEIIHCLMSVMN